ncbi:methyl-accepting chemotaxis protein [Bdellovibrionota bacterium FG-2]
MRTTDKKLGGRSQRRLLNILINPAYQLKYVFWISTTGLALIFVNAAVFYFYVRENYAILVDMSPMTAEAKALLYRELHEILLKLGAGSFIFLLAVVGMGIILSHRTAGPMFHFKRIFSSIEQGDMSARVRLRPKDDFQDVAQKFNAMMDALAKRIR